MLWPRQVPDAPGERGAAPRPPAGQAARREWVWLGASLLVVAATVTALLAFNGYEDKHRAAAAQAGAAQLAASEINALEWQSIDEGRLTPVAGAQAEELLDAVQRDLRQIGGASAPAEVYAKAVHNEFGLIAAGKMAAAQQVDHEHTDPAFQRLNAYLLHAASSHVKAAGTAASLRTIGDLCAAILGFLIVAALLLRFGSARRALVAAEVEQRLLRRTDEARSDLISVVSHDLRTPLTAITGYLEILRDEEAGPLTEEQRRFLAVMQRNADRLLVVVNDLLFISRSEVGRMELALEEINLGEIAAEAVEGQQPFAWQHQIDLRVSAAPAPPIMADRHRIDELIENLLSNALKFTPAAGTVEVTVRPSQDSVVLEVTDTGVGISHDDQKHLFEQFFRSASVMGTPGVGLGLAITKVIADAHQAAISVRSTQGKGTAFCVTFPAVMHRTATGAGSATAQGPQRHAGAPG